MSAPKPTNADDEADLQPGSIGRTTRRPPQVPRRLEDRIEELRVKVVAGPGTEEFEQTITELKAALR